MWAYLDQHISLSKAAEQLGLSRFELMERFDRLGVPLRIGPASMDEARDEVKTARQGKTSNK
jgi:predicted HTH domain antitoxin